MNKKVLLPLIVAASISPQLAEANGQCGSILNLGAAAKSVGRILGMNISDDGALFHKSENEALLEEKFIQEVISKYGLTGQPAQHMRQQILTAVSESLKADIETKKTNGEMALRLIVALGERNPAVGEQKLESDFEIQEFRRIRALPGSAYKAEIDNLSLKMDIGKSASALSKSVWTNIIILGSVSGMGYLIPEGELQRNVISINIQNGSNDSALLRIDITPNNVVKIAQVSQSLEAIDYKGSVRGLERIYNVSSDTFGRALETMNYSADGHRKSIRRHVIERLISYGFVNPDGTVNLTTPDLITDIPMDNLLTGETVSGANDVTTFPILMTRLPNLNPLMTAIDSTDQAVQRKISIKYDTVQDGEVTSFTDDITHQELTPEMLLLNSFWLGSSSENMGLRYEIGQLTMLTEQQQNAIGAGIGQGLRNIYSGNKTTLEETAALISTSTPYLIHETIAKATPLSIMSIEIVDGQEITENSTEVVIEVMLTHMNYLSHETELVTLQFSVPI